MSLLKTPMHILLCGNPGFYPHVAAAITSVACSHPDRLVQAHVIASQRDAHAEARLRASLAGRPNLRLSLYWRQLDDLAGFFVDKHLTRDCYLRLFAAGILPSSLDRVLYLDGDTITLADLWPLYSMALDGFALAAAPDLFGQHRRAALGMGQGQIYVNSGVLLLNLSFWRERNVTDALCAFIERNPGLLELHDQDAINAVLHDRILVVERRWNVQTAMFRAVRRCFPDCFDEIRAACRRPAIVHYAGPDKPWQFRSSTAGKRHYLRYRRLAAWPGEEPAPPGLMRRCEHGLDRMLAGLGIDYMHLLGKAGRAPAKLLALMMPAS